MYSNPHLVKRRFEAFGAGSEVPCTLADKGGEVATDGNQRRKKEGSVQNWIPCRGTG